MKKVIAILIVMSVADFSYASVDLVVVDKSARTLYLMESGVAVKRYRVALGSHPNGHKNQEGDEKTPEGIYTLDFKKEDSAFHRACILVIQMPRI